MRMRVLALVALIGLTVAGVPLLGNPASSEAAPILVGRVHETFNPEKGKIFVLFIGNDARSGNPNTSRADAIHLAGINTETMKGGILNFPRDSWVSIPGYGSGRINEALYYGGPELVAQTVESVTGITIDYWVMTGFVGFENMIKDLGGVKMHLPTAVYDQGGSGAALSAGTQTLKGYQALAYVRTRKAFADGDIDRSTNQGRFMIASLQKLRKDVSRNPGALMKWMSVARKWTRLDITPEEMFRLGVLASQVAPKDVGNVTVPVTLGMMGEASVVFITSGAQSIYARFRANGSL